MNDLIDRYRLLIGFLVTLAIFGPFAYYGYKTDEYLPVLFLLPILISGMYLFKGIVIPFLEKHKKGVTKIVIYFTCLIIIPSLFGLNFIGFTLTMLFLLKLNDYL